MSKFEKTLVNPNPAVLSLEICQHVRDGWRVDPDRPMALLGFLWEVWVIRDDEPGAPKPTRAEILTKARQAKAEKAKEEPTNE